MNEDEYSDVPDDAPDVPYEGGLSDEEVGFSYSRCLNDGEDYEDRVQDDPTSMPGHIPQWVHNLRCQSKLSNIKCLWHN